MTERFGDAAMLTDAIVSRVGRSVVLGLPVGIGKGIHIADALFQRAVDDPDMSLTIFTGLTLAPPAANGDLASRFIEPLVERLYRDWPTPRYAQALTRRELPENVEVREFYLRPGAYLNDVNVQQRYTSANYSHVARVLKDLGVNVIAQLVGVDTERPGRVSLGSNPELTLDLLTWIRQRRNSFALVGQVNRAMPYMGGDAELDESEFDGLLDAERYEFPLFGLPNRPVGAADYATAMHVASLVADGGTLQLGIGSLSDAVAHCLTLRDREPAVFASVLARLPGGSGCQRRQCLPIETGPFEHGLFASTELLSDALFALFERGIVRRSADAQDAASVHAGFFIGSDDFYERLRNMPAEQREQISMRSISAVNTLYGDETRKRHQRRAARFVNETMLVTLLGAAVSDALEDGRVVSGVGGQFDFVEMAHELDDAMSILMCRARRERRGAVSSNIRWHYGHATVPRHHRDVYVSEYGIAATRGRSDADVIAAMLHIADAGFQRELLRHAVGSGKLPSAFRIDPDAARNSPDELEHVFEDADVAAHFPPYPLGTSLSDDEQALARALTWLETLSAAPFRHWRDLIAAISQRPSRQYTTALERMALVRPQTLRERVTARLIGHALTRTQR